MMLCFIESKPGKMTQTSSRGCAKDCNVWSRPRHVSAFAGHIRLLSKIPPSRWTSSTHSFPIYSVTLHSSPSSPSIGSSMFRLSLGLWLCSNRTFCAFLPSYFYFLTFVNVVVVSCALGFGSIPCTLKQSRLLPSLVTSPRRCLKSHKVMEKTRRGSRWSRGCLNNVLTLQCSTLGFMRGRGAPREVCFRGLGMVLNMRYLYILP